MERKLFFKSIFTLIIAPSILKDVDFRSNAEIKRDDIIARKPPTGKYMSGEKLLMPEYYDQFVKRYGNENYTMAREFFSNHPNLSIVTNPNIFVYKKG